MPRRPLRIVAPLLILALAACGGGTVPATVSPGAPTADAAGSGARPTLGALPSTWPIDVPDAVITMGAMHNDLGTAVSELSAAVEAEDTAQMRIVAERLATFMDRNIPNAAKLQVEAFRHLGDPLVAAMTEIRDGARAIVRGLEAGDASAMAAGFRQIADGMDAYAQVQPIVAALMPEAMEQAGALVR